MKQKQEPRKINAGRDYEKAAKMRSQYTDACDLANKKVIPAMLALDFAVNVESVLKYTANPEQLKADYIAGRMRGNDTGNATLNAIIAEKFAQECEIYATIPESSAEVGEPSYYRLTQADESGEPTAPALEYDTDAVNAAADIWITDPDELAAYDRQQAAAVALNEFFGGNAPEDWNGKFSGYFGNRDGVIFAVTKPSYKRFAK